MNAQQEMHENSQTTFQDCARDLLLCDSECIPKPIEIQSEISASIPEMKLEQRKRKMDDVDSQFMETNKKMMLMEEKRNVLTTCYICLCKMKWPLQICDVGHFACADCVHKQCISTNSVMNSANNANVIPIYTLVWKIKFECGLCKQQANPKYAGPLVTQLIDPEPILNCPMCKGNFSESLIGMHILKCTEICCPLCKEKCNATLLNDHVKMDCLQIPCKKCDFKSNCSELQWHMKEHEIVRRTMKSFPIIIANISHNDAMQRLPSLLQALCSLNSVIIGPNQDYNLLQYKQLKKLLTSLGV